MTLDKDDLNDPRLWMVFAKSDLALARIGKSPEVRLGVLCFLCQQAAEKALKAVLLRHQVEFPPTHNLRDLFDLLPSPISAPSEVTLARDLSGYVVKGRYPLDLLDVSTEEYEKAMKLAERVLKWAEKTLQTPGKSDGLFFQEPPSPYRTAKPRAKVRSTRKKGKWPSAPSLNTQSHHSVRETPARYRATKRRGKPRRKIRRKK